MARRISVVEIKKKAGVGSSEIKIGEFGGVRILFGPHYFIELHRRTDGKVTFVMGATHHGFRADASEVGGELERLIEEIRQRHPDNTVD